MKKLSTVVVVLAFAFSLFSTSVADAATRVGGYTRKSTGTYVMPHYRSTPNYTKFDNYSTKGNYNPYTGKKGYVSPFKTFKFR